MPSLTFTFRLANRLVSRAIVLLLLFVAPSSPLMAAESTPQQFLTSIYKNYKGSDASGVRWRGSKAGQYFDAALTKLILQDLKESKGEVGRIEFDPFVDAQDFDLDKLDIKIVSQDANAASALVSFNNLGEPHEIAYDLVKTPKGWRIANMTWKRSGTGGDDLRSVLSRPL
ncbi:DUF3828 domain-containing protein [Microvirga rosea]|uniref:DUF3828 domain-containing protein n=1 Tax=Microvirga rosea TaxID=2715425 RepID=UPI001D0ADCDB|nr:DUF3828 domain-containing protein [Microvirga rosea]MCB8820491.1 YbjP/YqhG family protein [Microvirga rosea]